MSENINRNSLWNEGGKAALILGAVSIIYTLSTTLIAKISGGPMISAIVSVVNMMLWFAKFAGCILLMRFFMMKLVRKYPGTDNKTTFKFGTIVSFLDCFSLFSGKCSYDVFRRNQYSYNSASRGQSENAGSQYKKYAYGSYRQYTDIYILHNINILFLVRLDLVHDTI